MGAKWDTNITHIARPEFIDADAWKRILRAMLDNKLYASAWVVDVETGHKVIFAGIANPWGKVYELFCFQDQPWVNYSHKKALVRMAGKAMKLLKENGAWRIQITIAIGDARLAATEKLAAHLGMRFEGVLRGFGIRGQDCVMYGISFKKEAV